MKRPRWEFGLTLDRHRARPLFLQIAAAIAEDICRGRLEPGDPLPGTRALARSVGVNRVTVLTAYDELAAEGWIVIEPARGARVSAELPEALPRTVRPPVERGLPPAIYELPAIPDVERWPDPQPGVLLLNSWPDTRLVPTELLARAYRRALRTNGPRLLAYGHPSGHPALRRAIAEMLSISRGLAVSGDDVMITRGSQMALSLIARALLAGGKTVVVEAPGYPYAWQTFRLAGANLLPVPVDADGLDVAALERLIASQRVDAVYVTPHHQMPTTVTMSASRRAQLLGLVQRHRILVIEDDYDDAFHYEGRPVMPLASLDRAGVVAYVGTLSKVFAPGLRVGFVVAPRAVLECLSVHRQFLDIHGDAAMEVALAALLDDSEIQRHLRRARNIYRRRRDLLSTLLRRLPCEPLSFDTPAGGAALWARVAPDIDVDEWAEAAARRGVRFLTARTFAFDRRSRPFARFGFASVDEREIPAAVQRLAAALPARSAHNRRTAS